MKNVSYHTDLCELVTSLLMRIHVEEMTKLGWLVRLVKHAIYTDSLHFLYQPLLSISKILASSQHIRSRTRKKRKVNKKPEKLSAKREKSEHNKHSDTIVTKRQK
jgi:hypothetical protein